MYMDFVVFKHFEWYWMVGYSLLIFWLSLVALCVSVQSVACISPMHIIIIIIGNIQNTASCANIGYESMRHSFRCKQKVNCCRVICAATLPNEFIAHGLCIFSVILEIFLHSYEYASTRPTWKRWAILYWRYIHK